MMEIRSEEDTPMSKDLTPPIPPIAASLHEKFLPSHCSSCFLPLPYFNPPITDPLLSCSTCSASVKYCSKTCANTDSDRHSSTGECNFFILRPPCLAEVSTDIRAALRLIHLFELLRLLPSRRDSPVRISGLLSSGLVEVMEEGGELAEMIREGAKLMARVRNPNMVDCCRVEKVSIEEEVLWVVMMNAVEVEIGELGGIGLAVYGPWFSWFNHSCMPNACYRFQLVSGFEPSCSFDLGSFKVFPAGGDAEAVDVWKAWNFVDIGLAYGSFFSGPRIIIRNIKPLKKDEEVCIAYMDVLQPKALRHFDLWSRYRFVCYCKRCSISPLMYIDHILSCDARSMNMENHCCSDSEWMHISDCLEEAIAEYMLIGNPENCCRKLENMLVDSLHCELSDAFKSRFRLHPFHFLCLKSYIVLSSAYRMQACSGHYVNLIIEDSKNLKMARFAAACSLLVACATHHLFMSETSIITNIALFWVGAAESILYFIRIARSLGQFVGPGFCLKFLGSHFTIEGQSKSQEKLLVASVRFIDTVSLIMIDLWPFLARGHPYMECIENPANLHQVLITNSNESHHDGKNAGYGRQEFCRNRCDGRGNIVEWIGLNQLAFCSLMYSKHLANVCYGPESWLSGKIGDLERILKETVL